MEKTTTRKISEGTFWLSISGGLMKVIGIAYILFVLSRLSVVEYGFLELALSIPALLGFFSLAGLQPVIIADLIRTRTEGNLHEMRDRFSSYLSLRVILAACSAVGLYVATLFFDARFTSEVIVMVQLLCLSIFLSPLRSVVVIALNIMHDFRSLALFSFVEEAFKFLLVVIFLSFYDFGALGVVIAYVITDSVVAVAFGGAVYRARTVFFAGKFFSNDLFKPHFALHGHAKWSVFQSSLHLFGQNIRPWIIQIFLGVHAVGIYALAFGMYQHVTSLFPLSKVIAPIVPGFVKDEPKLVNLIQVTIKYDVLIQVLIGILSLIGIPILIYLFFPNYMEAYPLLAVLLFAMIPNSFSRIYESVFQALRLQKNLFSSNVVKLIITVSVAPFALTFFGLYGIAVEFFITSAFYAYGRYKVLGRVLPAYSMSTICYFFHMSELDRIVLQKTKVKLLSMLKI